MQERRPDPILDPQPQEEQKQLQHERAGQHSPKEPRTTVGLRAVLAPSPEVVPAADALPAGAHDREVVLPPEELLVLAPVAVPEVCLVDVSVVQPEALPVEPY